RHDAYHLYQDEMLFHVRRDPHQQQNLISTETGVTERGRNLLNQWLSENGSNAAAGRDPHDNVMAEGGPFHVRGQLPTYLERLEITDRGELAALLRTKWMPAHA
ncbi:MAG: sulfatase, partial [Pseudomonadota bacterium]